MSPKTEAVASRIAAEDKTKLKQAAQEYNVTLSTYIQKVIEDHVERNPHNLQALHKEGNTEGSNGSAGQESESSQTFVDEMLSDLE